MKKLFSLILAVLLVLSLAACGSSSGPAGTAPAEEAADYSSVYPVMAFMLADGVYQIEVKSSSSMFRVVYCDLEVKGGKMTAYMSMSAEGYGYVFPGKIADAETAAEEERIPFDRDKDGKKRFAFEIDALDTEYDCAAYSIKKDAWYDRVLVFKSDSIPETAYVKPVTVDVTLSGGSGRASIKSPCELYRKTGLDTAVIVWSSDHYEYMLMDELQYDPIQSEGNSTFAFPVIFDKDIAVSGLTTAMSEPHLIDYSLNFDSKSIR